MEAAGYLLEKRYEWRSPSDRDCMLDDPTSYREYHPVKVGIGLQGIGVTMILLTTLHLFRYNYARGIHADVFSIYKLERIYAFSFHPSVYMHMK